MPKDSGGQRAGPEGGWGDEDEPVAPTRGGFEPVKYLDDAPDDVWRDKLLWFFLPSLAVAITGWEALHNWFGTPDWVGWAFVVIDLAVYGLIAWRGPALVRLWTKPGSSTTQG